MSTKHLTTTNLNLMLKNYEIVMGTFPSDQIQIQKSGYPQAFIVNTEPSTSVGEHWTALFVSDKKCLFFDPLGNTKYFPFGNPKRCWHNQVQI